MCFVQCDMRKKNIRKKKYDKYWSNTYTGDNKCFPIIDSKGVRVTTVLCIDVDLRTNSLPSCFQI